MPIIANLYFDIRLLGFEMNTAITDEHFPTSAEPSLNGARLDRYSRKVSCRAILADLDRQDRRAANAAETLLYGKENPDAAKEGSIYGFGQMWRWRRKKLAAMLFSDYRLAGLHAIGMRRYENSQILSFPMTAGEIAVRNEENAFRAA